MDRTVARAKELIEQFNFEDNCLWLLENLLLDTPLIDIEMSNRDKPLTKLGWHTAHKFSVRDDVPVVDGTNTTNRWCAEGKYKFLREYRGPYKARDYEDPVGHDAFAITLEVNGELVLSVDLFVDYYSKPRHWTDKASFSPHLDPERRVFDWEKLEKLKLGRWIEDLDTIIFDQKHAHSEKAIQDALAEQNRRRKSEEKEKAEEEKRAREYAKTIDLGEYE